MPAKDKDSTLTLDCARLLLLAAHELRTPVSVVGGYLRMLQRDAATPLTAHQRKLVEEAEKSCGHLSALVAELSELGRLDGERAPLGHGEFDVFALVAEVAGEADRGDARISVEGKPAEARLAGDRVRLRAALSALLRAVLRERPSAPTMVVDRHLSGSLADRAAVIVMGAPEEVTTALEAPREPLDEGRGGLGLSLPIARRVVEQHGGSVWSAMAPGRPPGRGAVVVSLPCRVRAI